MFVVLEFSCGSQAKGPTFGTMGLILGVGVGLFVLILLWVLGILGCVALARAAGPIRQVSLKNLVRNIK